MQTAKPFILFFNPVRHAKAVYEELQKVARVEVVTSSSREQFFKDVQDKYKDIKAIYRTSASGAVGPLSPWQSVVRDSNVVGRWQF